MELKRATALLAAGLLAFVALVRVFRGLPDSALLKSIPAEVFAYTLVVIPLLLFMNAVLNHGRNGPKRLENGMFHGRTKSGSLVFTIVGATVLISLGIWLLAGAQSIAIDGQRMTWPMQILGGTVVMFGAIMVAPAAVHVSWNEEVLLTPDLLLQTREYRWSDLTGVEESNHGGKTAKLSFGNSGKTAVTDFNSAYEELIEFARRKLEQNAAQLLKQEDQQPVRARGEAFIDLNTRIFMFAIMSVCAGLFLWAGGHRLPIRGSVSDLATVAYVFLGMTLLAYGVMWLNRRIRWDETGVTANDFWGYRRRYSWKQLDKVATAEEGIRKLVFSGGRYVQVSPFWKGGRELIRFAESKLINA